MAGHSTIVREKREGGENEREREMRKREKGWLEKGLRRDGEG